jgi:hypothetical protein
MLRFIADDAVQALGFNPGQDPEIHIEQLIQAKDFVAGLSDSRARELHKWLLGGGLAGA